MVKRESIQVTEPKTVCAADIKRRLCLEFYRQHTAIPNYTPKDWYECDLFVVTDAGYFTEYEIKVSRSDFIADAKKARTEFHPVKSDDGLSWAGYRRIKSKSKHEMLAAKAFPSPNRFYFVLADSIKLEAEEIPEWAGLIYYQPGETWKRSALLTHKQAPLLHRQKINPAIVDHARGVCYYRMHNLIIKQ